MPVTNDEGSIAIKYLQEIPHVVRVHNNEYAFVVKANVNLTWVAPEDVDAILAVRGGCNCPGNYTRQKYLYANELDVQRWTR